MELQSKIFNKLKQRFTELMSSCRHNKTSLDTHTHTPPRTQTHLTQCVTGLKSALTISR